jgi:hypothetical protein
VERAYRSSYPLGLIAASVGAGRFHEYGECSWKAVGLALVASLEHLRGSALGFRNLTNYIARSLLETGGFKPQLHPGSG